MKVYRVEHKDSGLGPYRHTGSERIYDVPGLYSKCCRIQDRHPLPPEDGISDHFLWDEDWKCGFSSKRKLARWFRPVLNDLFNLGYRIVIYRCDDKHVVKGTNQVLYNPHYAWPIEIISERNAIKL